jgi:8-oxo-dGTP diphosphatase
MPTQSDPPSADRGLAAARSAHAPAANTHFIDHDTWFTQLPGVVVAAGALITDPAGRVLMVKPNYRDHWTIPGGICEQGEPPHAGCAREVTEEVGLVLPAGALLAVDWSQPYGLDSRPIMHFVFDGGTVSDTVHIVVQQEELDGYQFADPGQLADYAPRYVADRIAAAFAGRAAGATIYPPQRLS